MDTITGEYRNSTESVILSDILIGNTVHFVDLPVLFSSPDRTETLHEAP